MNNEAVNTGTPVAAVAEAPKSILATEFQEAPTIEITGNFRGFWRDVPVKDENDRPVMKDGQPVMRRQFKMTRNVKLGGTTVRQAAWLSEADAKEHALVDGVKYNLTLSVGEELNPSKTNGQPGYLDEFSFSDPTIISVNGK